MPSTYTLNNGIELIGTGEQSGTWGDTTNTNFELIDTALDGQVTVTLASAGTSGSPNSLPISDGAVSDGRNRLIIFNDGADLGATAYVQLTPNDAEKIVYVRNDLSGSRSIILFQGTYSTSNDYEVPAGTTAVVYFDGAGSGAVAANVFNNAYFDSLRLGSVSVTAILDEDNMASDSDTALATQQSIKAYVDAQVTAQDLDFAGDSGTGAVDLDSQTLTIAGTANEIETSASGQTVTVGLPNAVTITSLTATSADINGGTIDGTTIGGTTAAAITGTTITGTSFVSSGDMTFGDNDKAIFGAGSDLQIYHTGSVSVIADEGTGNLLIRGSDLRLQNTAGSNNYLKAVDGAEVELMHGGATKLATTSTGVDVTGTVTADGLTVDGSIVLDNASAQNISFTNTAVNPKISSVRALTIDIDSDGNQGTTAINFTHDNGAGTIATFSETGDISFYEDTGTTPKFFWDASAEKLELGSIQGGADGLLAVKTNADNHAIAIEEASGVEAYAIGVESSGSLGFYNSGSTTASVIFDDSGNVGIGTSSPASIVGGTDTSPVLSIGGTDSVLTTGDKAGSISFITNDGSYTGTYSDGVTAEIASVAETGVGGAYGLAFYTGTTTGSDRGERVRIDYAGNVGIGTSSPSANLHISSSAGALRLEDSDLGYYGGMIQSGGALFIDADLGGTAGVAGNMRFRVAGGTEAMRIDASGNVGIGVVPSAWNSAFDAVQIGRSTALWSQSNYDKVWLTTNAYLDSAGNFKYISTAPVSTYNQFDGTHRWSYAASGTAGTTATLTEAMRIDASGNVLVGGTSAGANDSVTIAPSGYIDVSGNGVGGYFNREGSDGEIVRFLKDDTTAGRIVSNVGSRTMLDGYPISHNFGTGMGFGYGTVSANPIFIPVDGSYNNIDNGVDLGYSSARFDDIYATNGTIQTSDRNEKQDIRDITEAEARVALACKGLLKAYRWKDAFAKKGDAARIHFGIIAQDLQDAFAAEGLDAGRYAMFTSNTWWETQTEVPAVEAQDAVLDEDGNVIQEAVEAKEAYTRTDTYDTAEEAPAGAVERTRLGVRYPELLAFIIAAI